jgi:DNA-binding IclR family transcriptional regulator
VNLRRSGYCTSLERGLSVLRCFTAEHPVIGITDVADQLGMSRSTTHRYMSTLTALGYLEQGAARKYRLGLGVTDLGIAAMNSTGLREHAHPYLEELRGRTSCTMALAVLDGADILYLERLLGSRRFNGHVELSLQAGSRVPAYCTAMGKLLVAELIAIAAPIRNESRDVVAAVSLSAHCSIIPLVELVEALAPQLISTAERISARLGYRRDDECR